MRNSKKMANHRLKPNMAFLCQTPVISRSGQPQHHKNKKNNKKAAIKNKRRASQLKGWLDKASRPFHDSYFWSWVRQAMHQPSAD